MRRRRLDYKKNVKSCSKLSAELYDYNIVVKNNVSMQRASSGWLYFKESGINSEFSSSYSVTAMVQL